MISSKVKPFWFLLNFVIIICSYPFLGIVDILNTKTLSHKVSKEILFLSLIRDFVFCFTMPFDSLWDTKQRLKDRFNSLILNNLSIIISALVNAAGIFPSVNRFLVHTLMSVR